MGKINRCLEYLFIVFNLLFAIFGCLMILSMIIGSFKSVERTAGAVERLGLVWSWVFSFSVFGISCLGVYAASSQKETPLKIFAGFMAAGMIIMLIFGFVVSAERDQIKRDFGSSAYTNLLSEALLITVGFYFGLSVIALLGLVISVVMIHQIRSPDSTGGSSIAMHVY